MSRGWGRSSYDRYGGFAPYVPVAERRAKAARHAQSMMKKGKPLQPVLLEGRTIARTFWGRAFCDHLNHFAELTNRLERGRSYVRNGSVIHLAVERGEVNALVSGSEIYEVRLTMQPIPAARWSALKGACVGHIGSLVELLEGRFDDATMGVLVAPETGLLPRQKELAYGCSCPDGAGGGWVCKHVAASMFGVGARLDTAPELLFKLRGVDPSELLSAVATADVTRAKARPESALAESELGEVFGIDLADSMGTSAPPGSPSRPGKRAAKVSAAKKSAAKTTATKTTATKESAARTSAAKTSAAKRSAAKRSVVTKSAAKETAAAEAARLMEAAARLCAQVDTALGALGLLVPRRRS